MTSRNFDLKKLSAWVNGMIAGLQAGGPAGLTTLAVGGKTYTVAALLTKLVSYKGPIDAVLQAEAALDGATEAFNEVGADAEAFIGQARTSIKGSLGKKSTELVKFGMKPNKDPEPLTVEEKAAKVARAKATREARHTSGPKQKSKIKGQVPPPATPPAAPQQPPNP